MTDEEMAEEYSTENWEYYEEGQNDSKALKQAYLSGLKAGRPQWHKVADGYYPPYDKCNCSINVFTNSGHIAYYNYDDECWIEVFSVIEINPPIAWCEIPKYTEE